MSHAPQIKIEENLAKLETSKAISKIKVRLCNSKIICNAESVTISQSWLCKSIVLIEKN